MAYDFWPLTSKKHLFVPITLFIVLILIINFSGLATAILCSTICSDEYSVFGYCVPNENYCHDVGGIVSTSGTCFDTSNPTCCCATGIVGGTTTTTSTSSTSSILLTTTTLTTSTSSIVTTTSSSTTTITFPMSTTSSTSTIVTTTLVPTTTTSITACTDTDGGLNYYVTGICMGDAITALTDTCIDSSNLKEFYCSVNQCNYVFYTCPNGCINGACVSPVMSTTTTTMMISTTTLPITTTIVGTTTITTMPTTTTMFMPTTTSLPPTTTTISTSTTVFAGKNCYEVCRDYYGVSESRCFYNINCAITDSGWIWTHDLRGDWDCETANPGNPYCCCPVGVTTTTSTLPITTTTIGSTTIIITTSTTILQTTTSVVSTTTTTIPTSKNCYETCRDYYNSSESRCFYNINCIISDSNLTWTYDSRGDWDCGSVNPSNPYCCCPVGVTTTTSTLPTTTSTTGTTIISTTITTTTIVTTTSTVTTSLEITTTVFEETTIEAPTTAQKIAPRILLDITAPKYVQPGEEFELEAKITALDADSGKLIISISYPVDFKIMPSENFSVNSIKRGETKTLTRTVAIDDYVADGERSIGGKVFDSLGNLVSSDQINVNVRKPYVIEVTPNTKVEIPRLEVLQEKMFYTVNKVVKNIFKSTVFWLTALLILIGLFYAYYRFREPIEPINKGQPLKEE